jgi:multimeric flavodoxin WrbA
MRHSDGFIFATPVNWFNMSSPMKHFIDWITSLEEDAGRYKTTGGKPAAIVAHCHSDGGNQAAMSLVGPLLHMGVMIPPFCAFYRNKYGSKGRGERWQLTDQVLVGQNVVRLTLANKHNAHGWRLKKKRK